MLHNGTQEQQQTCSARRYILASYAFVTVSFVAGVVYGWPSLRKELLSEANNSGGGDKAPSLSESQLGAAYTVGAWSSQGCRFLTGLARDRFGTRSTTTVCLLGTAAGFLGMALVDANSLAGLSISLFGMGLGSGAMLCLQPVASLFPDFAGSIVVALSGAFQVSGLVYLVLAQFDSRRTSYSVFAAGLFLWVGLGMVVLPKGSSFLLDDSESLQDQTDIAEKDGTSPLEEEEGQPDATQDDNQSAENKKEVPTAMKQILSFEYAMMITWFSFLVTPLQYYIGSIGFQLESRGDKTGFYSNLFTILYAATAILAPAVGLLADRFGVGIAQSLATALSAVSFFVLATNASLDVLIISLTCYGSGRMFVYGMFFAHIGKRFGYANFGTLAGLGLLVSAVLSLLEYPLIALAANGHDRIVNLACGILVACTLPYCAWLFRRERNQVQP
jgi:MFS transporter, LAT3 family, solute carrier family 43, member 3